MRIQLLVTLHLCRTCITDIPMPTSTHKTNATTVAIAIAARVEERGRGREGGREATNIEFLAYLDGTGWCLESERLALNALGDYSSTMSAPSWWVNYGGMAPRLRTFAIHFFCPMIVTSSDSERFLQAYNLIHTGVRSRLTHLKVDKYVSARWIMNQTARGNPSKSAIFHEKLPQGSRIPPRKSLSISLHGRKPR